MTVKPGDWVTPNETFLNKKGYDEYWKDWVTGYSPREIKYGEWYQVVETEDDEGRTFALLPIQRRTYRSYPFHVDYWTVKSKEDIFNELVDEYYSNNID